MRPSPNSPVAPVYRKFTKLVHRIRSGTRGAGRCAMRARSADCARSPQVQRSPPSCDHRRCWLAHPSCRRRRPSQPVHRSCRRRQPARRLVFHHPSRSPRPRCPARRDRRAAAAEEEEAVVSVAPVAKSCILCSTLYIHLVILYIKYTRRVKMTLPPMARRVGPPVAANSSPDGRVGPAERAAGQHSPAAALGPAGVLPAAGGRRFDWRIPPGDAATSSGRAPGAADAPAEGCGRRSWVISRGDHGAGVAAGRGGRGRGQRIVRQALL